MSPPDNYNITTIIVVSQYVIFNNFMLHKLSYLTKFDLMVAMYALLWYYNTKFLHKRRL